MRKAAGFVGRTDLVERVLQLVGGGESGVELVGPAGVGKTRAMTVCADAVTVTKGRRIVPVVANGVLSQVPYGALAPLLAEPLAGAIEPAEVCAAIGRSLDLDGAMLTIDDVQELDPWSEQVVTRLLAENDGFSALVTRRAGAGRTLPHLGPALETVEVGPLTRREIERMLASMLGGTVEPDLLEAGWRYSGGLPFFLEAFLDGALRDGAVVEGPEGWRINSERFDARSTTVSLMVQSALGADPEAIRAARLVAIAEPLDRERLALLSPAAAVGHIEEQGLVLSRGGTSLQIGHPLMGEVIRDGTSALVRRMLVTDLARSADALPPRTPLEAAAVARWRLDADLVDPGDALGLAEAAMAAGDVALCERLARFGRDHAPDPRLTALLAGALHHQGRFDESGPLLDEAIAATEDELTKVLLISQRAWRPYTDPASAIADLEHVGASLVGDHWQTFARVYSGWSLIMAGQPEAAAAQAAAAMETADDEAGRDEADKLMISALMLAGRLDECGGPYTRLDPARAAGPPQGWGGWQPMEHVFWAFREAFRGDLEAAEAVLHDLRLDPSDAVRGFAALCGGQVHQTAGDISGAIGWFRAAAGSTPVPQLREPLAGAGLAECGLLAGSDRSERLGVHLWESGRTTPLASGRIARYRALRMGLEGAPLAARVVCLREALAEVQPVLARGLESEVIVELALLGAADDGDAARMESLVESLGGPLPTARLALVRAVALADPAAIARAAADIEAVGARWEAARAFELASLRTEGTAEADRLAGRARELGEACGVARPFLALPARVAGLPAADRDVARRLASGLAAPGVAEALGRTPRSVRRSIERLHLRFGVSSRAELVAVATVEGGSAGPRAGPR